MAIRPSNVTLTNTSIEVLNAIRHDASIDYRNYVPFGRETGDIKRIGAIIMDNPQLRNEFIDTLVNRIAKVVVTSKLYRNPWAVFKKGLLGLGETVEEIFVDLINVQDYDPGVAETELYKRENPDVKSAFHILNFKKFYKLTINESELTLAFLSDSGVTDLVAKLVEKIYTSANYDELQVMKYMLAVQILNGLAIVTPSGATIQDKAKNIKAVSNKFTFMNRDYNLASVRTNSEKNSQYLITSADYDADMDINVLASAFNMDKAEFIGHRVLVDGFGVLDIERLNEIFENDTTYTEIGSTDLEALNSIDAILVDEDFFQIYDKKLEMRAAENGQGLYWNYFYHVWKTFSVSPFSNFTVFVDGTPEVTTVTVNPATASVLAGGSLQLTASVVTSDFAPERVVWSITAETTEDEASVDARGVVTVKSTATAGDSITVTATSVYDSTKAGSCVITVGGA